MEIKNISDITGNKNIALQNITANDITIYSGHEIKPEIKEAKKQIADKIANLIQVVGLLSEKQEDKFINIVSEDTFDDIDFDELIDEIKYGNCVLFLGPEISVDENDNSLHKQFFKRISKKENKYNETDGFFMPGAEAWLLTKTRKYYNNQFQEENTIAIAVLKKLAQIPFKLIVSLTPDDTMHQIFDNYNIKHTFSYYKGTKDDDFVFSKDSPILYNALGVARKNGRYIYTLKQFDEYIKNNIEAKFPFEIEKKIKKEATNYLFIGFDFNKWYNKLIMYELNLLPHVDSFAFDAGKTEITNQEFISEYFNVTFVDANYKEFTDLLLQKSKLAGLTKSLNQSFTESILLALENIRIKTIDSEKLEELKILEKKLQTISVENSL